MKAHYDDPNFSYADYWQGREYEHACETIALNRLLSQKQFAASADIGGGFGRLTRTIAHKSDLVYLIEPSLKQRRLAKKHLADLKNVRIVSGSSSQLPLASKSLDLAVLIRVMHHLPDPNPTLAEINRVLKPGGVLIFEFANSANFKARLTTLFTRTPIPASPLEKRSPKNIRLKTIPFVNHHPNMITNQLQSHSFIPVSRLSVSNFRAKFFKQILPLSILTTLEWILQPLLAAINFGPSIFIMARKPSP